MGRQNTIRIDYGALPTKPGMPKVQKFCAEKLGLKRDQVIRIQNSNALGVTFVTVFDFDLALKVVEEHGNGHEMTGSDKKQYPVKISIEDGTVLVKLYDLSADVTDADIRKFLECYGEVRDVYEEQFGDNEEFAGAYTGIRAVKMVVRENIPSWVIINAEQTKVSYYGQRHTCKHCQDFAHIGVGCVQNKKMLVQKTFADAVKQPAKPQTNKPKGDGKKKAAEPSLPKKTVEKKTQPTPEETQNKPTGDGSEPSPLMPPPADVPPSGSGLSHNSGLLQSHTGGGPLGKSAGSKTDGNETDSSTSSRRSLRNKNKKPRYGNDEEDEGDEEL